MEQATATFGVASMPNHPDDAHAHLVTHHGWTPGQPEVGMIQAHRYAHGIDGRPDLADADLDHVHSAPPSSPVKMDRRGPWRLMLTLGIVAWNAFMGAWVLYAVVVTAQGINECAVDTYADACASGASIGGGIAIVGILFVTALVDVILGVIWHVTKD